MYRKSTSDSVVIKDWIADIPGGLSDDRKTYMFPVVKSQMRTGKIALWLVTVRIYPSIEAATSDPDNPLEIPEDIASNVNKRDGYIARVLVYSRIGVEAGSECHVKEPTYITEGKYVGRANATNVYCQAIRYALGLYNKQCRRADIDAAQAAPGASDPCEQLDAEARVSTAQPMDTDAYSQVAMPRPMLASYYNDIFAPEDNPSPLFVQRKYNGVRAVGTCRADSEPILYSRTGLLYGGFAALKEDIRAICDAWRAGEINEKHGLRGIHPAGDIFIDGELYYHGAPLQIISGVVRRAKAHGTSEQPIDRARIPISPDFKNLTQHDLCFIMYDLFVVNKGSTASNGLTFDERYAIMRAISRWNEAQPDPDARLRKINFAETFSYVSKTGVGERAIDYAHELYARFLSEKFEGAIVRLNTPYEHSVNGRHSKGLLKLKPVHDAEFAIVGYTLGEHGRAAGALLFSCEVSPGGARFNVTPTGAVAARVKLAREFARITENGKTVFDNEWLGKPLIVYFDELSPAGVPQRARTDGILRTYE
jgi:hypothetical protein